MLENIFYSPTRTYTFFTLKVTIHWNVVTCRKHRLQHTIDESPGAECCLLSPFLLLTVCSVQMHPHHMAESEQMSIGDGVHAKTTVLFISYSLQHWHLCNSINTIKHIQQVHIFRYVFLYSDFLALMLDWFCVRYKSGFVGVLLHCVPCTVLDDIDIDI